MSLATPPPSEPDPREQILERRYEMLSLDSGFETVGSLSLLKESGASVQDAHNQVRSYGGRRWRLLKEAGYSVKELARFISPLGGDRDYTISQDIVGVPEFQLNLWTTLFYAGFSIAELKTVGFRGELTPEEEVELERIRYKYINGFDPPKT